VQCGSNPTSRAYRTVLLDAGHVCQTFCLVATCLDWQLSVPWLERFPSSKGNSGSTVLAESVIYIAGVGTPVLDTAAADAATSPWGRCRSSSYLLDATPGQELLKVCAGLVGLAHPIVENAQAIVYLDQLNGVRENHSFGFLSAARPRTLSVGIDSFPWPPRSIVCLGKDLQSQSRFFEGHGMLAASTAAFGLLSRRASRAPSIWRRTAGFGRLFSLMKPSRRAQFARPQAASSHLCRTNLLGRAARGHSHLGRVHDHSTMNHQQIPGSWLPTRFCFCLPRRIS